MLMLAKTMIDRTDNIEPGQSPSVNRNLLLCRASKGTTILSDTDTELMQMHEWF